MRWTALEKAKVVDVIVGGMMTREEAMSKHADLSRDELDSWISRYAAYGVKALKVKNTKLFRK